MANISIGEIVYVKDEIDLLLENIRYHKAIGVDYFLICDRGSSEAGLDRLEELAKNDNTFLFKQNVYQYPTDSKSFKNRRIDVFKKIIEVYSPDWLFAIDADEFLVSRHGDLRKTRLLAEADLLSMPKYNAAFDKQSGTDFIKRGIDPNKVFEQEIISKPTRLTRWNQMTNRLKYPIVRYGGPGKFFTRLKEIDGITPGFHDVETDRVIVKSTPNDLLILHIPFTTKDRFELKVVNMREHIRQIGHTFTRGQAWHWKRWVNEIHDAKTLEEEFSRQFFSAGELDKLRKENVIESIRSRFERM